MSSSLASSAATKPSSNTAKGESSAPTFAIIGAGLAGCTLARQLAEAGCHVDLFEKSRGTGGRLASCRIGNETADLGASWLEWEAKSTAHNLPFQDWLSEQEAAGHLHLWQPITQNFQREAQPERRRYVGHNRLSALTRSLIDHANIQLHSEVRIESVIPKIGAQGNRLLLTDTSHQELGKFDQVIVATPAPQAAPLLKAEPALQALAQQVQPDACWTLVLGFETPLSTPIELFEGEHPILRRVVRDSRKPGRHPAEDVWVIQARADWSLQMVDDEKEHVQKDLEHAFHQLLQSQPKADNARCHRWLYSTCTSLNLDSGFLHDPQTGLSVCGDWLAGFGFEASWQSAMALSHTLLSELKR
ncbi:NAD(P)/FAD-dependent oxidoreductase [Oceanospirillum sanctuarii]|uniref:NAD(P)/FAD-dependent oxidoreductase n=1 Tax=Oceanospirillum sanctuarii TaxID=1434821 RepID=UPI000A3B49AC|nr:FAD-dependent oxidoreductase [Oceanospirillum sanctuarii]